MTRPTTPAPDAASDDVRAPHDPDLFGRLYAASNHGGDTTTLPTDDVRAAVRAMLADDERIAHLDGELARLRALFDAGESIDIDDVVERLRATVGVRTVPADDADVAAACDAIEHLQAECGAARTQEELMLTVMGQELAALRETVARRPPPAADLAAIGARAAAYTAACDALALVIDDDRIAATGEHDAAFARRDDAAQASAADIPTLLALLAAERERHAAEVAAAVAAEREACAAACRDVASDAADDDPVSETADACAEAIDARAARS